jgi:hypothetical protein
VKDVISSMGRAAGTFDQRCGKRRFRSQAKAAQFGRGIKGSYGKSQRAYRCNRCGEWHLTTKPLRP